MGNFTDEQEQRGALLPQDTREYPLQSNEYHHNNKNGGKLATTNLNGERNYNNGPQCKFSRHLLLFFASFFFFFFCYNKKFKT